MPQHEQQRVAVGPGNANFISVHQVSSDAATLRRGRCGHAAQWPTRPRFYAAAADTAVGNMAIKTYLLIINT